MRAAPAALLLLLLSLVLSGCVQTDSSDASIDVAQTGGPADAEATATCPDQATLDLSVTVRDGSMRVQVLDGDGAVAFDETYEDPDGGETVRGLFGAPGTWRLVAGSDGFDGRLQATLSCG